MRCPAEGYKPGLAMIETKSERFQVETGRNQGLSNKIKVTKVGGSVSRGFACCSLYFSLCLRKSPVKKPTEMRTQPGSPPPSKAPVPLCLCLPHGDVVRCVFLRDPRGTALGFGPSSLALGIPSPSYCPHRRTPCRKPMERVLARGGCPHAADSYSLPPHQRSRSARPSVRPPGPQQSLWSIPVVTVGKCLVTIQRRVRSSWNAGPRFPQVGVTGGPLLHLACISLARGTVEGGRGRLWSLGHP